MSDAWVILLVLMPAGTPVPPEWQGARASLQRVEMALDLAAITETQVSWEAELNWARRAYELTRDCPPSTDADRWAGFRPGEELDFWRAVRRRLELATCWNTRQDQADSLSAIDGRIAVWHAIHDVQTSLTVRSRRQALSRLRELIGPEAYYSGRVPD